MEALLETWRINDRLNRYLLDALTDEQFQIALPKGKSVSANFAHLHNVRLMWLKSAAPELLAGQTKVEKDSPNRASMSERLTESGEAIEAMIRQAGTPNGKIKGFKPHATAFVGYLTCHEAYHRAMVEIALRQADCPLNDKVAYGLWEWGVR